MVESVFDRALDCFGTEGAASLPVIAVRPEGLEAALAGRPAGEAAFVRASGFVARAGEVRLLPGGEGLVGAMLGLGEDRSLWTHAGLAMTLPEGTVWHFEAGDFDSSAAVLGFVLGSYQYSRLSRPGRGRALLAAGSADAWAVAVGRGIWLARDLINTPANLLGPQELAGATGVLAANFAAISFRVEGAALEEAYPAVAAVGRGSVRAPVVAGFTWRGSGAIEDAPLVSLCGKGVCFDTGGYDLKPAAAMLRMKKDMGGAALMLGLASAIMRLDLPVRLAVRIGCVENMISGEAMRPSDVLRTRRGLTVEIGNTDAEGRLVLCDLMAEASDEQPDLMIDAATLTGAARVALGPDIPAIFTPDDAIGRELERIGAAVGDPVWRLPLHADYDAWLASPVADVNNVSLKPHAGAIIAALFLQRFVAKGVAWVHCDTYAWNEQSRPGRPEGGEAQALRALLGYVGRLNSVNVIAESIQLTSSR